MHIGRNCTKVGEHSAQLY